MKKKVVHITAHLGAGAGKAISGIAIRDDMFFHEIVLLDAPIKNDHIEKCIENNVKVYVCPESDLLTAIISKADIIVVNWWHHPSVYRALLEIERVKTRIVLWSHVNGLMYPNLKAPFIESFDACFFTSKASLENELWTDEERKRIIKNSRIIYGMGDFCPELFDHKEDYSIGSQVRIGYVGSLDYAKLNPGFVDYIRSATHIDERIRVYLVGDCLPDIQRDVDRNHLSDKVTFLGYRKEIPKLLKGFDIFVYLLNPQNFATTENALIEAMASGLPIIASKGVVEENIIINDIDGILIESKKEFCDQLEDLIRDEDKRKSLGSKAREDVIETYSIDKNIENYNYVLCELLEKPKREHHFSVVIGNTTHEWFFNACNDEEKSYFNQMLTREDSKITRDQLGNIFWGEAKGSVKQFYAFDNQDTVLKSILKKKEIERNNYES